VPQLGEIIMFQKTRIIELKRAIYTIAM